MRDARGVCLRDRNSDLDDEHEYFLGNIEKAKDFACQCKIDVCTCKRVKRRERYFNSHQVYRSQRYSSLGFADIGVGSVKTICRKRVRRVYLPDTEDKATGSSDIPFVHETSMNSQNACSNEKKTSSKCVGGVTENINKKLSPIYRNISNSTSPIFSINEKSEVSSNTEKNERFDKQIQLPNATLMKDSPTKRILAGSSKKELPTSTSVKVDISENRDLSSDSLVQHVHNLENPSIEKLKTSNDFIENKLEREYRKIFTTDRQDNTNSKDKPTTELKSPSILRRRFDALRRGLNKKEKPVVIKNSSNLSNPSKKDVSIASDPPSLISRSYSNVKVYSPMPSIANACNAPMSNPSYSKSGIDEKEASNWNTETAESDCQDVKDMFRLWGKKFNFDDNPNKTASKKQKKKVQLELPKDNLNKKEKGERKRFLFFGKKNKNKPKQPYRPKNGVTAGRCELGDGLMIKIGATNKCTPEVPVETIKDISQDYIIGKDWFKSFLSKKVESRNSVRIRWDNKMYTTSSSTVFELMDCVYKNTGVMISSKSEVTTGESSNPNTFFHPKANFMQQNIQAWMIPKTITDSPVPKTSVTTLCPNRNEEKNIEITFSDQKWFIEKSKAFSRKIEFVLHSKNLVKNIKPESSEYIVIDIPKGYFSETSSDDKNNNTSDEQVYNIVEYEKLNSNSYLNKKDVKPNTRDHSSNAIEVEVSVPDKNRNADRTLDSDTECEANIHPSNNYIQKGRDVISVQIITQRDLRDIKKPILKINTDTDDKSDHVLPPPKKCEFAESFLQDYYKDLSPLGIDLLSWCVSNNELRGSLESSSLRNSQNQGDGSKSCSNIYDDYQASTMVSSCETSSCSHCKIDVDKKEDYSKTNNFFSKFMKKNFEQMPIFEKKRVSPKDSLEVFKRRKVYALSNKSKWGVNDDASEPFFSSDLPNVKRSNLDICQKPKKKCKKEVLMQDGDVIDDINGELTETTAVEGILSFKGAGGRNACKPLGKKTHIIPDPICEIPPYPCTDSRSKTKTCCTENKNDDEKPCSDSPNQSDNQPKQQQQTDKPTPQRTQAPMKSSPKASDVCICARDKSTCTIPTCPINKKKSCVSPPPCMSASTSHDSVTKCRFTHSSEKCNKTSSQVFPWPLKNQISNSPSRESTMPPRTCSGPCATPKTSNKYTTTYKRINQVSNSSFEKDCRSNCANRRKVPCSPAPPCSIPNKCMPKKPGLQQKNVPIPKCHLQRDGAHEYSTQDDSNHVIRLNSTENLTIKFKDVTPSTEEIREGCNIKVQDEDGQTLYERRDYKRLDKNRMVLVKDMYRDSQVQRLSTSNADDILDKRQMSVHECKSDASTSNIIEINLSFKFKHGDKTKELNLNKSLGTLPRENHPVNVQNKSSKQIYVVQDKPKLFNEDTEKRDVDIKIMIKNYKASAKLIPTNKHSVNLPATDEFSNKISDKFHTVSTGYSDIIERQTHSIHRTTIDLANSSDNKPISKHRFQLTTKELKDVNDTCKQMCKSCVIEDINNFNTSKESKEEILTSNIISQIELNTSVEKTDATIDDQSATTISIVNSVENAILDGIKIEDDGNLKNKKYSKKEKKKIFKQLLERASEIKKRRNKTEIQEMHQLLRAVLTSDSSDFDDNKKLPKDLTNVSAKRDYIKDPNSVKNYYSNKSSMSTKVCSKIELGDLLYPSKDEVCENNGISRIKENENCLCNQLATKLNIKQNFGSPCCCRCIGKIDEEISCDIKENDDKSSNIGVETQCSEQVNANYLSVATSKKEVFREMINKNSAKQTVLTHKQIKSCQYNTTDRQSLLRVTNINKINETYSKIEFNTKNFNKSKVVHIKSADILQLNETKKAVLEIYAEKTISNGEKHMIAKLPKFIFGRENDIYHYQA